MPRTLLWAIPGIVLWAVLQFLAAKFCTGWREEKVKYGFLALGCLAWWVPNLLVGESGASEVEQLVLFAGFPVAACYLAYLLIGEWLDKRCIKDWEAKPDSEKLQIGWKGRE